MIMFLLELNVIFTSCSLSHYCARYLDNNRLSGTIPYNVGKVMTLHKLYVRQ